MKNLERKDIELMAPVGSYETLQAAIQGNANAVYFGVGNLNMRSKSTNNFGYNDLKNIVEKCKEHNLKSYVTVNSVMYDQDIAQMKELLEQCKLNNVSAIIASDISVLEYAREIGLEIHISTQQNISNTEAVKFFSKYADVMVLARELNMKQVKEIYNNIEKENITGPNGEKVALEMFAHGALCMAISGKCYLSLHEYNKSANRGECLQICRRAYTVTDKETNAQLDVDNEYIMSPKDLCTINFLDKLIDAGVSVLKIEGRARSAEYVKTVCECYDDAINAVVSKNYTKEKIDIWMNKLSRVYNRGFWDGYYLGKKLGEWSNTYGSRATKKKIYIGKALNYFSNIKVAEFLIETHSVQTGDQIIIIGPTTGVVEQEVNEIRVELKPVSSALKGERVSIAVKMPIRRSDKLYKLIDVEDF